MNKQQRKQLEVIANNLEAISGCPSETVEDWAAIAEAIGGAQSEIESMRDDEQEKMDNMPESLQGSERHSALEDAISSLEDAMASLEEAKGVAEDKDRDLDSFEDVVCESAADAADTLRSI